MLLLHACISKPPPTLVMGTHLEMSAAFSGQQLKINSLVMQLVTFAETLQFAFIVSMVKYSYYL